MRIGLRQIPKKRRPAPHTISPASNVEDAPGAEQIGPAPIVNLLNAQCEAICTESKRAVSRRPEKGRAATEVARRDGRVRKSKAVVLTYSRDSHQGVNSFNKGRSRARLARVVRHLKNGRPLQHSTSHEHLFCGRFDVTSEQEANLSKCKANNN